MNFITKMNPSIKKYIALKKNWSITKKGSSVIKVSPYAHGDKDVTSIEHQRLDVSQCEAYISTFLLLQI